jgi:hypothetical protein
MAQLKRWESPRREGRNDKGRGGSARQRQKQKQMKALRQKLKSSHLKPSHSADSSSSSQSNPPAGKSLQPLPSYFLNPQILIHPLLFDPSTANVVPKTLNTGYLTPSPPARRIADPVQAWLKPG